MDINNSFDVVGFGVACLDYICVINKIANYNQSTEIIDVKNYGGGCVSTALVAFQRLGGKSAFISMLGDDSIGKEILKGLEEENINCNGVEIIKNVFSPFSFVQVSKKFGKRSIAFNFGSYKFLKFSESAKKMVKRGKILIIDGLRPLEDIKAAQFARNNNIKVMLDANTIKDGTHELLSYIDYLITSEAFLYEYSGDKNTENSLKKLYKNYKPEVLITTLGKKGSIALDNNKFIDFGIFDVKVKDTTGCGDVYHGACLFGLLKGWEIRNIMIFATAVSSIKSMYYGGRFGIPDFNKTVGFLKEREINIDKFRI
jgi:sulfofructose kinase